jgi:hypothetical protein
MVAPPIPAATTAWLAHSLMVTTRALEVARIDHVLVATGRGE